jgi:nucleoside-diphosphate-sugar epimerase
MSQTERVYVTGAAGMIGSSLCKALVAGGYRVVGIDNLWRGVLANLDSVRSHAAFEFRHADIASDRDWFADIRAEDSIVHTADIVGGIEYVFSNEWRVFQTNVLINTQIARIAQTHEPRQLIYLGTACSYPQGMQRSVGTSVLREADKFPADPESGYGWSKLMGEIEFKLALKGTRTRFTVLDLHNVYGWPCIYADRTAQVIPSLVKKALTTTDGKLVVWGDGNQGRAFIHVRDVVDGIVRALRYQGEHRNFMLGPGECTTIRDVATLIQQHPKAKVDAIVYDTSKPVGDIGRYADSTLAQQELGWRSTVVLRDGLHELIDAIHADLARAG